MTSRPGDPLRSARLVASSIVGTLVAIGVTLTLASDSGSVLRDLGLAVLSGGIVGGSLVTVESLLVGAAERRAQHDQLLTQLSATTDLSGIDLANQDLSGVYLPSRKLVAGRLDSADLRAAQLVFGDLRHASLTGADLEGADLAGATLAFADLRGANLTDANLDDADLSDARLVGARLSGATLRGANLRRTDFRDACLNGVVLADCFLHGADLRAEGIDADMLAGNEYDGTTRFPADHVAPESTPVTQAPINAMDLPEYLAWRSRGRPLG